MIKYILMVKVTHQRPCEKSVPYILERREYMRSQLPKKVALAREDKAHGKEIA
jgi:hypothetical protein